jgi:hypothetical protein
MKRNPFENPLAVLLFAACLWGAPSLAVAQTSRDALEAARADLKADRKVVIASEMNLTEAEGEKFWPLYREYRAEVEKVSDTVVKLILEYADLYPTVPEERAEKLLKQYTKAEASLLKTRTTYLKKFGKVLPASKVFRFAQLDNRLDLATRLSLAASIPLMPAK